MDRLQSCCLWTVDKPTLPRPDDNVVDFSMADKLHSTYMTNHSYISAAGGEVLENMHLIRSLDCTLMAIERSHYIASIGDFP